MNHLIQFKHVLGLIIALKIILTGSLAYAAYAQYQTPDGLDWDPRFVWFFLVGFFAQLVDGALGMAYGVTCSSLLLALGIPPAATSANVHIAKVYTAGVSGMSHLFFKNVDKDLLIKLSIGGILGAVLGTYLLTDVLNGKMVKPFISLYLLFLGVRILYRSFRKTAPTDPVQSGVGFLGFVGGTFDAIGGGGWGPIVTSNLLNRSTSPREVIGSVNTAEFFMAIACGGMLIMTNGVQHWSVMGALILGGVMAAPLGAWLVKFVAPHTIMRLAGGLIVLTSFWAVYEAWWPK
jgi:uncharacterized membrane protein YfcA